MQATEWPDISVRMSTCSSVPRIASRPYLKVPEAEVRPIVSGPKPGKAGGSLDNAGPHVLSGGPFPSLDPEDHDHMSADYG